MKKALLIIAVAMLTMAAANAQYYIGGSFGIANNTTELNYDGYDYELKTTLFLIAPELGYNLTEKTDLGIKIGFGRESYKMKHFKDAETTHAFIFAPYVRYSMFDFGRCSVLYKAELSFESGKERIEDRYDDYFQKYTHFGINLKPVLKYDLTDRFCLLADLNFLTIGVNRHKVKNGGTETSFGLLLNTDNVASIGSESALTIGFAYSF